DGAPGVDQHDVALTKLLRLYAAVRERRVLAEDHERAVGVAAELPRRRRHRRAELRVRHALLHTLERGADRLERDVVRALHQRDLGGRLDHATARRHWRGADVLRAGKALTHAVEDEEANALLEADLAVRRSAIAQNAGDHLVRALVFLPHANVIRELDQLA